jgi:hypothetical protein
MEGIFLKFRQNCRHPTQKGKRVWWKRLFAQGRKPTVTGMEMMKGDGDLPLVVLALDASCRLAAPLDGWQYQTQQQSRNAQYS